VLTRVVNQVGDSGPLGTQAITLDTTPPPAPDSVARVSGGLTVTFDKAQVAAGDTLIVNDGGKQTAYTLTAADITEGKATVSGAFSAGPQTVGLGETFSGGTPIQTGDFVVTTASNSVISNFDGLSYYGNAGNALWIGKDNNGVMGLTSFEFEIRPVSGPVSQMKFTLGANESSDPEKSFARFYDENGVLLGSVPLPADDWTFVNFTAPAGKMIAYVQVTIDSDSGGLVLDTITTTDPGHAPGNFDSVVKGTEQIHVSIVDPAGNSSDARSPDGTLAPVQDLQTINSADTGVHTGGAGNSIFSIGAVSDVADGINGGGGVDTLKLTGANQTLDLTSAALHGKLQSVEIIDLTGTGDNTLKLSVDDVLELGEKDLFHTNGRLQVMVKGNQGDSVILSDMLPNGMDVGDWMPAGAVTVDGVVYNVLQFSGLSAELLVQEGVSVELTQHSAATVLTIGKDSGSNTTDFLTNDGDAGRLITGKLDNALAAGERLEVSTDGGVTWSSAIVSGTQWAAQDMNAHSSGWNVWTRVMNAANEIGEVGVKAIALDTTPPPVPDSVARIAGGLTVTFDKTQVVAGDTLIVRDGDKQTAYTLTAVDIAAGQATVSGAFSAGPQTIGLGATFSGGTPIQTGDFVVTTASISEISDFGGSSAAGNVGNSLWIGRDSNGAEFLTTFEFEIRPVSGPVSQMKFTLGANGESDPANSSARFYDENGVLLGSIPLPAANWKIVDFTAPAGKMIAYVQVTIDPDRSGIVLDSITTTDPGHAPGNFDSVIQGPDQVQVSIVDQAGNSSDARSPSGTVTPVQDLQTINSADTGVHTGGHGNSTFLVASTSDVAKGVNGGDGIDTLKLTGAGQTLDLTSAALHGKLQSVEVIDLTGTGDNQLVLSVADVLDLGQQGAFDAGHPALVQMLVKGDAGDSVTLSDVLPGAGGMDAGDWSQQAGTVTVDGVEYVAYTFSTLNAELLVQSGVNVTLNQTLNDIEYPTVDVLGSGLQPSLTASATADDQTLTGTVGNDLLSDAGHANVTLNGSAGDDLFQIGNASTEVNGGTGFDGLVVVGHGLNLDLSRVTGIEEVNLGANGSNTLAVTLSDVLSLPDATPNTLIVTGDATDTVRLSASDGFTHANGDTQIIGGVTFDVWHASSGMDVATLLLEQSLGIQNVA
jgi:hypothetical protein